MGFGYSFTGFSGKAYSYAFTDLKVAAPLPRQGGLYIFAKGDAANPQPVFIDAVHSIRTALQEKTVLCEAAQKVHGAMLFYFRPNPDAPSRAAEQTDLIMAYKPAMNIQG